MIAIEVASNAGSFNCETCAHKNCDSDGSRLNSRGPGLPGQWEIKGVIKSDVCLLPMISDFSRECMRLYRHYKNGVLLRAGGLYDQPRAYIDAMGLIDGYNPTKN